MSILEKIFGDSNRRVLSRLQPTVDLINQLEPDLQKKTDRELRAQSQKLKEKAEKISDDKELESYLSEILPEAFALVREAGKRTLGMRHFDVQLLGGMVLHQGSIAEMTTGEGKTLVATLPLYLNALSGRGVHLITVNDYLSRAHTEWMGPIYNFLGLSVGCLNHESSFIYQPIDEGEIKEESKKGHQADLGELNSPNLKPITRQDAYKLDVLYGTNNEFGFDYLRDNMAISEKQVVQRPLNFAIVDEVDSILIDEARTPLIISSPVEQSLSEYQKFAMLAASLKTESDYVIDEKERTVTLTEIGLKKVEGMLGVKNIYESEGVMLVHHLEEALKAKALFKRNRDYLVKEGEVIIIDEFTGRLMQGRRYSEGLHQAIEAKEGVEVKKESLTMATISFQNLFRLYRKLAGMTGTAITEAEEFYKIYKLDVTAIPTNKPLVRRDHQDRIYKSGNAKFDAVVNEIKERNANGQPVLVGTVSVATNEKLSRLLKSAGIKHQLLNAKHHSREAKVIARAGEKGAVTIATNMAGRGTDIRLGEGVVGLGGLLVIGTERHESRRIDNQLRGRAGRQGDPGESIFFVSMEDDLMRIFGGERLRNIMNALGLPDDLPIENKMISRSIESAQKKVEGHNFDIRKHLVEYDDVMNKHREVIYRRRRRILYGEDEKTANEYGDVDSKSIKDDILEVLEREINRVVTTPSDDREKQLTELKTIFGEQFDNKEISTSNLVKLAQNTYEEREKKFGVELMRQVERSIYLRVIDMLWVEHLTTMEQLRGGIGLVGYSQKDPLVEYKAQAYGRFHDLVSTIEATLARYILKVEVTPSPTSNQQNQSQLKYQGPSEAEAGGGFGEANQKSNIKNQNYQTSDNHQTPGTQPLIRGKVGRNDPCPCGSGKKYKRCCGR